MDFKKFLFIWLLSLSLSLQARPPELTPESTKNKIQEILKAHSTYKHLSDEVTARLMANFVEELDPSKTYLLTDEVVGWIEPEASYIQHVKDNIEKNNFEPFESVYFKMKAAIERRESIEQWIKEQELPKDVDEKSLGTKKWAASLHELKDRLLKIRALQTNVAKKFHNDDLNLYFKRLEKIRSKKSHELFGNNTTEMKKQLFAYVLKSLASALDNHTAYFTPSEASQFVIQVQQRLFGIGAHLRDDLNGLNILRLLDGGPAALSKKIKIGDRIVAVNGDPIIGMDMTDAVELIRGPQGTKVNLTLRRNDDSSQEDTTSSTFDVEILRDEIVLKESRIDSAIEPYGSGNIGYIHLHSFYQDPTSSSYKDIKNTICDFKKKGPLLGLILDLRNNGGGLLDQAQDVSSLFLKKGIIASIKDSEGNVKHLRNLKDYKAFDGPLLVLINSASASASEIVAQCLQDYGRAVIVGDEHSYGKGTYQTFTLESSRHEFSINPEGEFKVTRGIYYTVSGKSPQLNGTLSDVIVPGILSKMEIGEKYTKNPLQPDEIKPNFVDDLKDVHPLHRFAVRKLYAKDQEKPTTAWKPVIDTLKINSKQRLESNIAYQNFLKKLDNLENLDEDSLNDKKDDYQLQEAYNIMKEMILLAPAA